MNVKFTFKNFDPSDHLKEYATNRFEKLGKYLNSYEDAAIGVNMAVEKFRHNIEVIVSAENIHISAFERSEDMYSSVDMVLDKLEAQLRKMREKTKSRRKRDRINSVHHNVIAYPGDSFSGEKTIVASDSYTPKPMDIDEAAEQLGTLNCEFLVFRNSESDDINVIYKRKDGNFGLIDPGVE